MGKWKVDQLPPSRPDFMWPECWTTMSKNAKKQQYNNEKENTQRDAARELAEIIDVLLEDEDDEDTVQSSEKKLERPA